MNGLRLALRRAARTLVALAATIAIASCGGDSSGPDDSGAATLLDVSLNLVQGETCDQAAVARDFAAIAGGRITITVTAPSNRNVQVVLYAPDYETQLGSAQSSQGTARFIVTLAAGGTHHVNVCEQDGLAATVRLVVTQAVL